MKLFSLRDPAGPVGLSPPAAAVLLALLAGCASGAPAGGGPSGGMPVDPPGATVDAGSPPPADTAPSAPTPPLGTGPLIPELIGRIQLEDVRAQMQALQDLSQPNRATGTEGYRKATEWIRQLVNEAAPAAQVRFDERAELRNVEIKLPGTDPAAGVYIVGGHLDSVRRTPGMDDNGSGSLGAALLARALGNYTFKAEIRFVLFDAEENGLVGSTYYARSLLMNCPPRTCLKFFLNLDMIGHDPENRKRVQIFTASTPIFDLLSTAEKTHAVGLTVNRSSTDSCNSSDDCSFSKQGYDTGYVFEAKYFPMRHTPADTVEVINFDTMTRILKLVAASIATAAGIEGRR